MKKVVTIKCGNTEIKRMDRDKEEEQRLDGRTPFEQVGLLMVSSMTQLWMSLGARARAREREREREKNDASKISLEQKEKKTERDRETNSEGRTPLDPVGVSMVS